MQFYKLFYICYVVSVERLLRTQL